MASDGLRLTVTPYLTRVCQGAKLSRLAKMPLTRGGRRLTVKRGEDLLIGCKIMGLQPWWREFTQAKPTAGDCEARRWGKEGGDGRYL